MVYDKSASLAVGANEAARIAGICRSKIFENIREGHLPAKKLGRRTLILRGDLEAWLNGLPAASGLAAKAKYRSV